MINSLCLSLFEQLPTQDDIKIDGRALSQKSTKAPTVKSTKAPTIKSTKAPTVKSTKAPAVKSERRELNSED